jgi:hypothetical protein
MHLGVGNERIGPASGSTGSCARTAHISAMESSWIERADQLGL